MIEWKGLFANTPYSSANNKAQDDAVVGMQDTIYVTGPGYGSYSANVRVHNASGAVVALIPVSGGGGALSAPAPVRILDDSTAYSYSLEVVRGAVPSDDADKIVIRIVGGASKRYPGQGSTLADGSTSFAGPVRAPGLQLTASSFAKTLTSQGLRIVGWGSSSMAECSRPQRVNVRLNSTDYADGWNGFLWPAITRGIPFHMEWNGGVANTDTAQVLASIDTDLADPNFPDPSSIDAAVILPWANELPAGTSAEATEAGVLAKVLALLAAYPHWKIIIVVPHSRNPVASSHAIYQSAVRVAQRIAGRDPRIAVANHYEALAPTGVDTPSTLLRADGIHLSTRGGDALYGVWAAIARWLGFVPKAPHILEGSPIMTVSGAGAVPWGSNVIVTTTIAAGAANEFGTPRWLLTGTAAAGNACLIGNTQLLAASRPIVAGRYYRLYIDDMTIITAAGASTQYGPGGIVTAPSAPSIRWRPLSWYAAGAFQAIEAGQRIQNYYGPIIKATAAMATQTQIGLYPGAGGGQILASFASLLELP